MDIGRRIVFNPSTGTVLNGTLGEASGDIKDDLRPESIDFIDLPYGYNENNFALAVEYKVNLETRKIEIISYFDPQTGNVVPA
ncbi:MAG: hypothetical protein ACQEW2_10765 [Bacillota bacterium]